MGGWLVLLRAAACMAAAAVALQRDVAHRRRVEGWNSILGMDISGDTLDLRHPTGARCSVKKHGAHVCSWNPAGENEVLFMSEWAKFGDGDAIRGGIPICFPQFGPRGELPQHGFMRKSNDWQLSSQFTSKAGDMVLTFRHTDTEATRASAWSHPFEAEYEVRLTKDTLTTKLKVKNTGKEDASFTCALHTYFGVGEVGQALVGGFKGVEYEDSADGGKVKMEQGDRVGFWGEVDRVYGPTPKQLVVEDGVMGRTIVITKDSGFPDAVVWNPWVSKARALSDLPDASFRRFVCVEVGAVRKPVTVRAGAEWEGAQTLCVKRPKLPPE